MSIVTCQKLQVLVWKILINSSYSQDLAPKDYHFFFLALQNFLSDKRLSSIEDFINPINKSFSITMTKTSMREQYAATFFKMAKDYTTKRCIFCLNRRVRNVLNNVLKFMQITDWYINWYWKIIFFRHKIVLFQ